MPFTSVAIAERDNRKNDCLLSDLPYRKGKLSVHTFCLLKFRILRVVIPYIKQALVEDNRLDGAREQGPCMFSKT
jgi:hypothetical protein